MDEFTSSLLTSDNLVLNERNLWRELRFREVTLQTASLGRCSWPEAGNASDFPTGDQGVDVIRAFECVDGFQITESLQGDHKMNAFKR